MDIILCVVLVLGSHWPAQIVELIELAVLKVRVR